MFSGLPQYEATKAYMPKEPDELGLQQAELVILLQKEEGEVSLHVHLAPSLPVYVKTRLSGSNEPSNKARKNA